MNAAAHLSRLQRAHRALDDIAEAAHEEAKEHVHALDNCRAELTRISALCAPLIGDANSAEDAVRRLVALAESGRRHHFDASQLEEMAPSVVREGGVVRYADGRLDELVVFAPECVHLEDMGSNGWCLIVNVGAKAINVALPRPCSAVVVENDLCKVEGEATERKPAKKKPRRKK